MTCAAVPIAFVIFVLLHIPLCYWFVGMLKKRRSNKHKVRILSLLMTKLRNPIASNPIQEAMSQIMLHQLYILLVFRWLWRYLQSCSSLSIVCRTFSGADGTLKFPQEEKDDAEARPWGVDVLQAYMDKQLGKECVLISADQHWRA